MTARELITRRLLKAEAEVQLCTDLLNDIDGEEEQARATANTSDEAAGHTARRKPGKKKGARGIPKPSTNGHTEASGTGSPTERAILHALAAGAKTPKEIAEATGIGKATVQPRLSVNAHGWWEKTGTGLRDPYQLTIKGRQAVEKAAGE